MDDKNHFADLILMHDAVALQDKAFHERLAGYINSLILNNFDDLIYLLYKVDVSEKKLKSVLKENLQEDAANIIASLLIERQLQKLKLKAEFRTDKFDDEAERW